ncbi:MAG: translational GTPase TypA [Oscillospiraceae bacterium]|nr:translational GTPase TypA [Oscillospiraceae bacterium]
MKQEKLRNVAIIAHVDHGKTTLVDEMLKQGGVFRAGQEVEDRVMDSNAIERERGITILAKNTSVMYNGTKINIVDTPGHADFSGEVERILIMVDGFLILVDDFEGPMPQTRFVLQKALELDHKVIVVVNKVDKPDARPLEVVDEVLELLLDLDATEEQLESPVLFCSGRAGTASLAPDDAGSDLVPLFETIIKHIDCPEGEFDAPLQTLVSAIDYNDYVGRIGVGRVERGVIRAGQEVMVTNAINPEQSYNARINTIYVIECLNRTPVKEAEMGEIICFSGIEKISIGDTVCSPEDVTALPFVKISEPTVEMLFCVNDSPMAGREGKFVTSRQIADRLFKELLKDVSLRVERTDSTDAFKVMGRGEMHLSILIENMRREGYELAVTPPQVLYKTIDGEKCEPMEEVLIDTPDEYVGTIIEKLSSRKGTLLNMHPQGSRTRIEFVIPVRGLFGYRNEFLTDTKGEGIMNSRFKGYEAFKGEISRRSYGSLIAFEGGTAVTYGLFNAQERGQLFIGAGVEVYEGMIIGQNPKGDDMAVNVCKKKHITNTRASGSDEALRLIPPRKMSLEQCIEFLSADELLEVTPKSLRLRKKTLSNTQRMKDNAKK